MIFDEMEAGKIIDAKLKEINAKVYPRIAPRGGVFPYGVYTLGTAFQISPSSWEFTLTINCWDNNGDNVADLISFVKNLQALNEVYCFSETVGLDFYLESIITIPDPSEHLARKQINYKMIYYNKE